MKSIACLPVSVKDNPYQYLMINGLDQSPKLSAFNGVNDKFFGIIRTVIKYKPNYLHFDWITSYYIRRTGWMTLLFLPLFYLQIFCVCYLTSTKIVWTLHNIQPHNAKYLWLHRKVRHFFGKKCSWIRLFSEDSIVRACEELKLNPSKFQIIPEGDYISEYKNLISQSEARSILKIGLSKKVFLSLGYIKPYKGLEKLINEFSQQGEKEDVLVIAGQSMDSLYTENLKRKIASYAHVDIRLIDTFIATDDLQVYYNAANAVVLPFEKVENSGSVIMAMGFKKAILAPKMGVIKKRLEEQDFLLYNNLKDGLNTIFAISDVELEQIGLRNFENLKQYTWKDFCQAFK